MILFLTGFGVGGLLVFAGMYIISSNAFKSIKDSSAKIKSLSSSAEENALLKKSEELLEKQKNETKKE